MPKDKVQLRRYIAVIILFIANACFWALFEQAGSSSNLFVAMVRKSGKTGTRTSDQ